MEDGDQMSEPKPAVPSAPIRDLGQQSVEVFQTATGGSIGVTKQSSLEFLPDKGDVAISKERLKKISDICEDAIASKRNAADLFLGVASLFAGAFFSGWFSGVPYDSSIKGILTYTIFPVIAAGCGIAYFFLHRNDYISVNTLATHVKEYIPEDFLKTGDKHES